MNIANANHTKPIPQSQWVEFFDTLSNGNRGRNIKLVVSEAGTGNLEPVKDTPLMSIICDPDGKGNDIIIETGRTEVNYAHTVSNPIEVVESQDENGKLIALAITDQNKAQTTVSFL